VGVGVGLGLVVVVDLLLHAERRAIAAARATRPNRCMFMGSPHRLSAARLGQGSKESQIRLPHPSSWVGPPAAEDAWVSGRSQQSARANGDDVIRVWDRGRPARGRSLQGEQDSRGHAGHPRRCPSPPLRSMVLFSTLTASTRSS
jgi:hypothetical protein